MEEKKYRIIFSNTEKSWLVATDLTFSECVELVEKQIDPSSYSIEEIKKQTQ